MADKTSMFFLIQWEDRFLSVIHPNKVVQPKKSESNYKEGEIITALFGKEKYEAVICEIHTDKKFLEKRAALPPKYKYDEVKETTKGVLESMGQQEKAGEKRTDSIEQVTEAGVLVESKGQEVKANDKTPDSTEQVAEAGELVESKGPEVKANDKTPDSTEQVTEAAAFSVETKKSDSSCILLSGKRRPGSDDGSLSSELKEDVRSLRRKLRKLEERVCALESKEPTVRDNGEMEKMKLVEHMDSTDVQRVLTTLAKAIFSDDQLINCSRTGKKTAKCSGTPRPPLDQQKLILLETVVRKKTNVSKECFQKKFENLQKTLRQKNK